MFFKGYYLWPLEPLERCCAQKKKFSLGDTEKTLVLNFTHHQDAIFS